MGILRDNKRNFILVLMLINIYAVAHFPDKKTLKEHQLKTKSEEWINNHNEKGYLENKGQMMDVEGKPAPFVLFKTEMPNANLWITEYGITLQTLKIEEDEKKEREKRKDIPDIEEEKTKVYWERVDIELKGANIKKENIVKEEPMQGYFNFFYPHCSDGIYGVKEYRKIIIKNVYPNIDWVWYQDKEKGYKYDFVVHPGGDYKQIHLLYKSKRPIKINENGELEIRTDYGNFKELRPVSFYDRKVIDAKFQIKEQKRININGDKGFESLVVFSIPQIKDKKDLHFDLVIDPQIYWATFYGGNNLDGPMSADTDNNGNLFITGYTGSSNFPIQNAGTFFQGIYSGGTVDVFIMKFDNPGNRLWATYYGGSLDDSGYSITIDINSNVAITGWTYSDDFPVQNTGTFFQGTKSGLYDAFIIKFDNNGNRLWATYYGGSLHDFGYSINTDNTGNVFVTGYTNSTNFPLQNAGAFFQGSFNGGLYDAFILKFDNSGNRLWATYYGGNAYDLCTSITTDAYGNIFITGVTSSINFPIQNSGAFYQGSNSGGTNDAFILKFDNFGNRLWATYYGGSGDDRGYSINTDGSGNVFVTGITTSTDFPVQNAGAFYQVTNGGHSDAFILKFDNFGNRLWATYYGGNDFEYYGSYTTYDNLSVDNCGNIYVSLHTSSNPFPYLQNTCDGQYYDSTYNNFSDILLSLFSNTGSLLWCTYLGGDGMDFREALAIDPNNNLFVVGEWTQVSNNATYPLTNIGSAYYDSTFNGGYDDGYIVKFCSSPCICSPFNGCIVVLSALVYTHNNSCYNQCVGSATAIPSGGTPPYTYSWLPTGQTTSVVTSLCAGTYTLVISDAASNTFTTTFIINQLPPLLPSITANSPLCSGGSLTLTGTPNGMVSYNWTGPNGFSSTLQNPVINNVSISNAGTYTLSVYDGTCTTTTTLNVIIYNSPSPSITANNPLCSGDTLSLISTPNGMVLYNWIGPSGFSSTLQNPVINNVNTSNSGIYSLSVYDGTCTGTATLNVIINEIPSSSITANTPLCSGQTLTLTSSPNGMVSYNWTGPNGFSSTLQNPVINYVSTSNSGTYTLSVNDGTCTGTTTLNVVIYNSPKPSITANSPLCLGQTLTLTGTPNGMTSYNWTGPNGFSSSYQNNIITNVSTAASGIYTLVVTDNNGCQGDTTLFVNVYPLPIITLSLYNDSCNIGKGQITANVINGTPPYQYQWNTGNTTHQIINLHQGWYIITVTDFNNCTQTDSIQITNWNADCEPFIEIPNVFTPNEDGVNDYFFVKGRNIIEIQCIILDRWGIEMFNDVAQRNYIQWNGKNKSGGDVPTGTYFYIINYKGLDSKIHQKKGYITLLR